MWLLLMGTESSFPRMHFFCARFCCSFVFLLKLRLSITLLCLWPSFPLNYTAAWNRADTHRKILRWQSINAGYEAEIRRSVKTWSGWQSLLLFVNSSVDWQDVLSESKESLWACSQDLLIRELLLGSDLLPEEFCSSSSPITILTAAQRTARLSTLLKKNLFALMTFYSERQPSHPVFSCRAPVLLTATLQMCTDLSLESAEQLSDADITINHCWFLLKLEDLTQDQAHTSGRVYRPSPHYPQGTRDLPPPLQRGIVGQIWLIILCFLFQSHFLPALPLACGLLLWQQCN